MIDQYIQLGATFTLSLLLIEIIKKLIDYLYKKSNNGLEKSISIISENHLTHIYTEMKEQTMQHNRMIELLIEINTTLKNKK